MVTCDILGGIGQVEDTMPQKCAVVNCTNRLDNKERWIVMPHVKELSFHSCIDPNHVSVWTELISPGSRKGKGVSHLTNVCSNHFPLGQPFPTSPFPVLYLRGYDDDVDDDVAAIQYVLRDSRNTDHDYPKLRSHQEEKVGDISTVCIEEDEVDDKTEQIPKSTSLTCVKDAAHHCEQKGARHITASETDTWTSHQPISVNKDEFCLANVSLTRKRKPAVMASHSKVNAGTVEEPQQLKRRKRSCANRDTDHIYNTRKSKCVRDTKKTSDRDTDHLYNSRKLKTSDVFLRCESNRDTDHMYNMPKTKLLELNRSAVSNSKCTDDVSSVERKEPETVVYVDKRVVDKDHMYQHRVRKNRNKSENRSIELNPCAQTRKLLKPKGIEILEDSRIKDTSVSHESGIFHHKVPVTESESGHSYLTRSSRKTPKEIVNKQKTCAFSKDISAVESPAPENEHVAFSSGTVIASPAHSDNDSDHVFDDDSRKAGVGHIDHLYVHFSPDGTEGPPTQTPCFSAECYKQEHSYANSEEIHYDACVSCSKLVQQLIGTIRQQGDHIDELKKQLHAANAKNKQLTSLLSHKPESVD